LYLQQTEVCQNDKIFLHHTQHPRMNENTVKSLITPNHILRHVTSK